MKTVVIGLGNLGLAMGRRLAARFPGQILGVELNVDRARVWATMTDEEPLSHVSQIPWHDVDRIFLVVLTEQQTETVLAETAACYVAAGCRQTITVFVTTTISPAFAQRLPEMAVDGVHLVELPVTGGEVGALSGTLTALAAGSWTESDEAYLQIVFSRIVRFPRLGDPAWAKLLANALVAYQVAAIDEITAMAQARGIDAGQMVDTIIHSAATNYVSTAIFDYNAGLLQKDCDLLSASFGSLPIIQDANSVDWRFGRLRRRLSGQGDRG